MKRMLIFIAASYAVLLAVIAGLSIALQRERARRCLSIPEVPEQVRKKMADLASLAADTAADIDSYASRRIKDARALAERAAHALR